MGKLDGKVAVITGAASGIGKATAELFVSEGARVILADIDDAGGNEVQKALGAATRYQHCDVTASADVKGAVQAAVKHFGKIDIMYNNAGFTGVRGPIDQIDEDGYEKTMALLVRSVFLGMKHAAAAMKPQRSGCIVSTASVAGLITNFNIPHIYSVAKSAVVFMTQSVAVELGQFGIRVNCVCPGYIATTIFPKAVGVPSQLMGKATEVMEQIFSEAQPVKRAGTPADVAKGVLWLASDDAGFVNGHALIIDGGLVAGPSWDDTTDPRKARLLKALNLA